MRFSKFSKLYVLTSILVLFLVLIINLLIDPYSITKYNFFNIPNKFARDDRQEKVSKLNKEDAYDNIIFGSSRVYVTNPLVISKYLGGRTYNCGVGRARIEDQLGFLLYLKKINKLPKNALFGLDFYSFNPNIETNKYFVQSSELNFLQTETLTSTYLSKFLSLDAVRASFKTISHFIKSNQNIPRFGDHGGYFHVSKVFDYYPKKIENTKFEDKLIEVDKNNIKTINYNQISKNRLIYVKNIVDLCKNNDINCTFFTTPLNGQMLEEFSKEKTSEKSLIKFKKEISKITPYYDFLYHNKIIDNRFYFMDTMHFTVNAGNLMFARIFNDNNISLPEKFGVYTKKQNED